MYAFPLARFREKKVTELKKCISMHVETRLRKNGICLLVARHFHCLYKFKVVRMRVASVWARRTRKSRSSSGVSARGKSTGKRKRVHGNGDRQMH